MHLTRAPLALALAVAAVACLTAPLFAAELHVPADFATIQSAVDASVDGDTVLVAPGTYAEAIDLSGRKITLASEGGAAATILDGLTVTTASILTADSGETLETVVRGFTFRDGQGTTAEACELGGRLGGAIFLRNASLTVLDSVFLSNGSGQLKFPVNGGGAIFACNANLTVRNTRFEENHSNFGGAVRFSTLSSFAITPPTHAVFEDTTFVGNGSAHGGAIQIFLGNSSTATVVRSTFDGNDATHGGAVRAVGTRSAAVLVADSSFTGGSAAFGGGLNFTAEDSTVVEVLRSEINGNVAGFGAGIFATASGTPDQPGGRIHVDASRLHGNLARECCDVGLYADGCIVDNPGQNGLYWGGAADFRTIEGGTITMTNSVVTSNDASAAGGIHSSSCGGGTVRIVNCTILDNVPSSVHSRIWALESPESKTTHVTVANSIVRGGDEPRVSVQSTDPKSTFDVRFSNIDGGHAGEGNIDAPPLFVDPARCDYRLLAGSPGVDAGDNAAIPEDVTTDRRGEPRFADDPETPDTGVGSGAIVDMGAYEVHEPGRRRPVRRELSGCPPARADP